MPQLVVRQESNSAGLLYWFDYVDPDSPTGVRRVAGLRLIANVLIGSDPPPWTEDTRVRVEAIIDTGAGVSLIPRCFWEHLPPDQCRRFLPAGLPVGDICCRSNILGRPYSYQFGILHIGVIDFEARRLRAVPVLGQLIQEEDHPLDRPVLGLSESILTGRSLRRHYSPRHPHEQVWWLQEA